MKRSLPIGERTARPGRLLAVVAAAPFAIGWLAGSGDSGLLPHVVCPLRAATGVPCPLCGATRSVILASHGDAGFLSLNPVWVVVLALLVVGGAAVAMADARGVDVAAARRRLPRSAGWWAAALVLAAGWSVALVHRQAIAGA